MGLFWPHFLEKCKPTNLFVEAFFLVMKNFPIWKITHQNNTAGEKNNLGLMSDLFT